jgi:hypothetical protein
MYRLSLINKRDTHYQSAICIIYPQIACISSQFPNNSSRVPFA